jgi:5'-3' exonuclease
LIDEFVFLMNFCGNDFLPNLEGVNIFKKGIDIIIEFYKYHRMKGGQRFVDGKSFNLKAIGNFLDGLVRIERQNSWRKFIQMRRKTPTDGKEGQLIIFKLKNRVQRRERRG